jgi:NAD(P)-dependent dehydrogenase (short-subunit alcohol dehydrogenase family)
VSICVTGGSSGIGRAIAERFAAPGVDVFLNYHADEEAAAEAAGAVAARGGTAHLIRADVGELDGIRAIAAAVGERVGRLDQLVHAAGMAIRGRLVDFDAETLDRAVAVNGTSFAHLVRETLPLLGEGSSVFFVTSAGSTRALPGYGGLGAPKALAEHLARYLATELAPRGIRVNCISPGPLDTAARRQMFPDTWEERLEQQVAATPAGRGLTFEDVAAVVELMSHEDFRMTFGQTVTIDGGLTL